MSTLSIDARFTNAIKTLPHNKKASASINREVQAAAKALIKDIGTLGKESLPRLLNAYATSRDLFLRTLKGGGFNRLFYSNTRKWARLGLINLRAKLLKECSPEDVLQHIRQALDSEKGQSKLSHATCALIESAFKIYWNNTPVRKQLYSLLDKLPPDYLNETLDMRRDIAFLQDLQIKLAEKREVLRAIKKTPKNSPLSEQTAQLIIAFIKHNGGNQPTLFELMFAMAEQNPSFFCAHLKHFFPETILPQDTLYSIGGTLSQPDQRDSYALYFKLCPKKLEDLYKAHAERWSETIKFSSVNLKNPTDIGLCHGYALTGLSPLPFTKEERRQKAREIQYDYLNDLAPEFDPEVLDALKLPIPKKLPIYPIKYFPHFILQSLKQAKKNNRSTDKMYIDLHCTHSNKGHAVGYSSDGTLIDNEAMKRMDHFKTAQERTAQIAHYMARAWPLFTHFQPYLFSVKK